MQLITILLYTVVVLALLAGLAVLCGSTKQSRVSGIWFFLSAVGAAIWAVSMALFFTLPSSSASAMPNIIVGVITGVTLNEVALLGFTSWRKNASGKIITTIACLIGLSLITLQALNPSLFYNNITFGPDYNQLHLTYNWYFFALIIFFFIISIIQSKGLTELSKHTRIRNAKKGIKFFQIVLSISGFLSMLFSLVLITPCPSLVWIGPITVCASVAAFYYAVVRYRVMQLSGKWMEVLSYIMLIAIGLIGYVLIFYLLFTAIFHTPSPAPGILILNAAMSAVVLCSIPALLEVIAMIKSLLPSKNLDIGYIVKKLDRLKKSDVDLKELASFLALTLKVDYVALKVNNKTYESTTNSHKQYEIDRSYTLKDAKENPCGQIYLGHPIAHASFDRWSLSQVEMVVNLVGIVVAKN